MKGIIVAVPFALLAAMVLLAQSGGGGVGRADEGGGTNGGLGAPANEVADPVPAPIQAHPIIPNQPNPIPPNQPNPNPNQPGTGTNSLAPP